MKAIIISHEDGGSYVMDKAGSFRFVRGYDELPIGAEIELEKPRAVVYYPKFAAAAAACLVIVIGIFAWMWTSESYYIYIDANPSARLAFNRFNRLLNASPLNEDAEEILGNLNLRGSPEEVVIALIRTAVYNRELDALQYPPAVLISFVPSQGRSAEIHKRSIADALESNGMRDIDIVKLCGYDYHETARELGVSPGRLRLANQCLADDETACLQDLLDLPLRDLMATAR